MRLSGKRLLIKPVAALLLLLLAAKFSSCEPEDWIVEVDCSDCYGYKPDSANLVVKVSINAENDSVPLTFYLGNYEDGVIDWQDTATTEVFYLYSKMKSNYTVRATYHSGNKIIEAFDADRMHLQYAGEECSSPCYIVKGGIFDVRLKE